MPNAAFVEALADCAEAGDINLQELRLKCLAAIQAGNGEVDFLTTAGGNGKNVVRQSLMSPADLLAAVNQAIRISNGTNVGITYADFSGLR